MQHLYINFKKFPKNKARYDQIIVVINQLSKQAISIPYYKTIDAKGIAKLFI